MRRVLAATALSATAALAAVVGSASSAYAGHMGPGELLGESTAAALPQGLLANAVPSDLLAVKGLPGGGPADAVGSAGR